MICVQHSPIEHFVKYKQIEIDRRLPLTIKTVLRWGNEDIVSMFGFRSVNKQKHNVVKMKLKCRKEERKIAHVAVPGNAKLRGCNGPPGVVRGDGAEPNIWDRRDLRTMLPHSTGHCAWKFD
jgi:hypothetical protein